MFCFTFRVNGNSKKNGFLICIVVSITIYFIEFCAELYVV
jgi:hypothetical protein